MKLLTLDISTACTGWALFENLKLIDYGSITPKIKGITKLRYPYSSMARILAMADEIEALTFGINPDKIIIEEVNRGISRKSQKPLDAVHFFILDRIIDYDIEYIDSDGRDGWRSMLGLRLTDEDKKHNRSRKTARKDKINKKHLAIRYVKANFGLELSIKDNDIADAIGIGAGYYVSCKNKENRP